MIFNPSIYLLKCFFFIIIITLKLRFKGILQSSDSFHGFGYTFWNFWIIALHLLNKLWILHILATSITEETCIVEMRIWCRKIGTVNVIKTKLPNTICFILINCIKFCIFQYIRIEHH